MTKQTRVWASMTPYATNEPVYIIDKIQGVPVLTFPSIRTEPFRVNEHISEEELIALASTVDLVVSKPK